MSSDYNVFLNDGKSQMVERFVYGDYETITDLAITKIGFHAYICTLDGSVEWTCRLTTRQDAKARAKEFVNSMS